MKSPHVIEGRFKKRITVVTSTACAQADPWAEQRCEFCAGGLPPAQQDFAAEVRRLTGGAGVDVLYDSVGRTTFDRSLDCLARRGMMVLYGASSGPVPPFDPQILNRKGSLFVTRPTLGDYVATRAELLARAHEVLGWVAAGALDVRIDRVLPLADAADAHRALEARQTTGKVILIP